MSFLTICAGAKFVENLAEIKIPIMLKPSFVGIPSDPHLLLGRAKAFRSHWRMMATTMMMTKVIKGDEIDDDNGNDVWDDVYLLLGRTKAFTIHRRGKRRWEEDLSRVFGFSIKLEAKIGDTWVVAMLPGSWLKRGRRSSGDDLG